MPASRLTALLCAAVLCGACARPAAEQPMTDSRYMLGTVCTITLLSGGNDAVLGAAFARLAEIEGRMSANKTGTMLEKVNEAAGKGPVAVSEDLYTVIERALAFAEASGGAFDPTVGPLVKLWEIGFDDAKVPSEAGIRNALTLLGRKDVVLDGKAKTVFLKRPGMRLDLGAIAKGYAGDEVVRILGEGKVGSAIVDLGGNIVTFGKKADGKPWRVGVQNPFDSRGDYIGILKVDGTMAVVTSGVYERFFEENGKRYHHILDTTTGRPVENGIVSVTIIAPSSFDADGLSTSVFALGLGKGFEFVARYPGMHAVIIDSNSRVYLTPGTSTVFQLVDTSFSIAE
ncbi:MAG: FAD:protein FMN transferase [Spirochaetes bacterium]|nr:FAD:protein FMN transferase [Spirochaetota bacterium]